MDRSECRGDIDDAVIRIGDDGQVCVHHLRAALPEGSQQARTDRVQERLRAAGADARAVGRELARELIEEAREKAAGVYLVAPFRRPLGILEVL